MKLKAIVLPLASIGLVGAMATSSFADGYWHAERQRNEWNGLAIGSAALGIFGLATHQDGLALAGAIGTGYSLYRAGNVHDGWGHRDYDDYRYTYRPVYRDRYEWRDNDSYRYAYRVHRDRDGWRDRDSYRYNYRSEYRNRGDRRDRDGDRDDFRRDRDGNRGWRR